MGTLIKPPSIWPPPPGDQSAGDLCTTCWGTVGKPFGPGDTPDHVQLTASGIQLKPVGIPTFPPFEGSILLPQVGSPCSFIGGVGVYHFFVLFAPAYTYVSIDIPSHYYSQVFYASVASACQTLFDNEYSHPYFGGSVLLQIPGVV